jgi:pSer/pThr/pTyr-binding forkhead associated (FHA) protein
LDKKFLSSRKHAEIIMEDNHFAIVAKKTTNGTYLDGRELKPGKPKRLTNNAKITFGKRGVKFVFRTPTQKQQS